MGEFLQKADQRLLVDHKILKNFGNARPEHEGNFCWPDKKMLEEMQRPITVTAIKVKGNLNGRRNGVIASIQLVCENGLESPVFDVNSPSEDKEWKVVELTTQNITRIRAQSNGNGAIG